MTFISDNVLTEVAIHRGKAALRAGRARDRAGFTRAQNEMVDVLERCTCPNLALAGVVQALGEAKSRVLQIDKPVIAVALASEEERERFYQRGSRMLASEVLV